MQPPLSPVHPAPHLPLIPGQPHALPLTILTLPRSVMKLQPPRHSSPQTDGRASVRMGAGFGGEWRELQLGGQEMEPHSGLRPHHPCRQPAKPP